jgi:hypothetical protein
MRRATISLLAMVIVSACNSSDGSPMAPTTPAANQSPSVTSVTVNPAFGIAGLQTFNFSAVASDPDGDGLSYTWNLGGQTFTGATQQLVPNAGVSGPGTAMVTVTDGRGGTASGSVGFVVGNMTGTWQATTGPLAGAILNLTQTSSGIVEGTWSHPIGSGETDPDQPGSINAAGQVTMRLKVTTGSFLDFNINGSMAATGATVTGTLDGSGFTGDPIVLEKQ